MVSPTTSFIEELAQLDKMQLARSTSDLGHGGGVVEEEGDKDDAISSKCCFIRTSSFRRTMRGKKSLRCKKLERSRNLVSSLLDDVLELVVERPALKVLLEDGNNSTRFSPQSKNLQVGSPEVEPTTRLSCSTPVCHPDSLCATPSSFHSFLFEPSLCQLSKGGAHNATVLDSSVSSDEGSFAGDVLRALDEKLCGEILLKSPKKCEESILRFTTGASMKPPLLSDSAVLEKRVRSPSRRGDRIALISPAPFRASLPKEMPKAKVEIEILRRRMANSPCFPGRYSLPYTGLPCSSVEHVFLPQHANVLAVECNLAGVLNIASGRSQQSRPRHWQHLSQLGHLGACRGSG